MKSAEKPRFRRVQACFRAAIYDKLKKRVNEKQLKEIEKFLRVYDKNYCEEIDFYFKEGFKLGLRIAVECFEEKE